MPATETHHGLPASVQRERLAPLLYRRVSQAYYRRSERFARHARRVGAENVLPFPPLEDELLIYLAHRLPEKWVSRLDVGGLVRAASWLALGINCVGRCAALLLWPFRLGWRALAWTRRGYHAVRRRSHLATLGFQRRTSLHNLNLLLANAQSAVWLHGFEYGGNTLRVELRRRSRANLCQAFVHAYPRDVAALPADRIAYGFFSLDHFMRLELPDWPKSHAYSDITSLESLPPGDYRIEYGLFDLTRGERLAVAGGDRSSVDLGWVRVERPRSVAPSPQAREQTHAAP